MQLPNSGNQTGLHPFYCADGTIATGGASQLVLPRAVSRSFLYIQNISAANMYVEIGNARATATIAGGLITGFTITNGGFGYTRPPQVWLYGGGNQNNASFVAVGQPDYPPPPHPGSAHAVLTGGVVTSIVIDDPGALYAAAPMVFLAGDPLDPKGVADPDFSGTNSGIFLGPGQSYYMNGTSCPTTPVAIWGATTGQAFTCRWMT
jgi:hypothetical protein